MDDGLAPDANGNAEGGLTMSNEEVCIALLITFGTFHIALLIIVLLIDNKIDKIQEILKKLSNKEYEHFN